jgi:hypothetical protein
MSVTDEFTQSFVLPVEVEQIALTELKVVLARTAKEFVDARLDTKKKRIDYLKWSLDNGNQLPEKWHDRQGASEEEFFAALGTYCKTTIFDKCLLEIKLREEHKRRGFM